MSEQRYDAATEGSDAGPEREADPGQLRRTTEQGDELTQEHSLAQREHRAKTPFRPPRQPAQDPPDHPG